MSTALSRPVRIALLTFTQTEQEAVLAVLRSSAQRQGSDQRWTLNSGEISFLPVGRAGNVSAASFVARNVTPSTYDYLVTYGCAAATSSKDVCRCSAVRDPSCAAAYLVAHGRYHEVGRIEAPASIELVTLKTDVLQSAANSFGLPLALALWGNVGLPIAGAFVSEKVVHIAPAALPSPIPKRICYGQALGGFTTPLPTLIDMESSGVVAGAPWYWGLTAAIRVPTDGGVDKHADVDKVLQRSRLNAHTSDLLAVLDHLTTQPAMPPWLFWQAVPPGVLRDAVRMNRLNLDDTELLVTTVGRMVAAIRHYLDLVDGSGLEDESLGQAARNALEGGGYPEDLFPRLGHVSTRVPSAWDLLVLAAEDPVPPAFEVDSAELESEAADVRGRATRLAEEIRRRLFDQLDS
jgi:hypothetical protein